MARAFNQYLYPSDLMGVGSGALSVEDSLLAVRKYVESWLRHQVLLRYAQENLPDEAQRLDDRLREYKESLLIYAYENVLLQNNLDTTFTKEEIQTYYDQNRDAFTLRNTIVRLRWIVVHRDQRAEVDSVRHWLRQPRDLHLLKLRSFCRRFAARCELPDDVWYNKEELTTLLPTDQFNFDHSLYNYRFVEATDSLFRYFIKFEDYRFKGTTAPIEYVEDEIKTILLNRRTMTYLDQIRRMMYEEAERKNHVEIFLPSPAHP